MLLEKEILGFNYAEVGGELLKSWNLSASIYEIVANHVDLECDERFNLDSAIIHIANILVLQEESYKTGFSAPNLDLQALQMTCLNDEDLDLVKTEANRNMAEILKLFFT